MFWLCLLYVFLTITTTIGSIAFTAICLDFAKNFFEDVFKKK